MRLNIGAFSFSAKVDPKDFDFKLRRVDKISLYADADLIMRYVEYTPKGVISIMGVIPFYDHLLEKNRKANTVSDIFNRLSYAIQEAY